MAMLTVLELSGDVLCLVHVNLDWQGKDVKKQIHHITGICVCQQKVVVGDLELMDLAKISELGLDRDDFVCTLIRQPLPDRICDEYWCSRDGCGKYRCIVRPPRGFCATCLNTAGFTARDLKTANFDVHQLRGAGFHAAEMRQIKITCESGCGDVWDRVVGFTSAELHNGGFDAQQLLDAGCSSLEVIRGCPITFQQLLDAGVDVRHLLKCDVRHLRKQSFDAHQAMRAGVKLRQLIRMGFTEPELRDAGISTKLLFSASQAFEEAAV